MPIYQHRNINGEILALPPDKVVCVGSNYAKHITEMGSPVPEEPVLFIKPTPALCDLTQPLFIPNDQGSVHHEIELAVLINKTLKNADCDDVSDSVYGYAIALDLTLRDLQSALKKAGHPWEKAKSFDRSCPISGFIPIHEFHENIQNTHLKLCVNGKIRQHASTADMIMDVLPLIAFMSRFFTLCAGDVILTGTPEGVGPLFSGDQLELSLNDFCVNTVIR